MVPNLSEIVETRFRTTKIMGPQRSGPTYLMRYIIESFGGEVRGIKKLRCCRDAKRQEVKDSA